MSSVEIGALARQVEPYASVVVQTDQQARELELVGYAAGDLVGVGAVEGFLD